MTSVDNDFSMVESDYEDDDSFMMIDEENMAPVPRKVKKAASKKNSILSPRNDNVSNAPAKTTAKGKKSKTIEETYQKKSQLEHILLRPDTYIGSTEPLETPMFIYDSEQDAIVNKTITYTPGLYKIFDEIIVNAADNKQRDPNMDKLDVVVDEENNSISVKNNGKGIPVVHHKEHGCYVPTLIFGHLLTGSNFDDDEEKTTGGRNGYGAKLANIFSSEFIIECLDSERGLKFVQTFTDNMGKAGEPTVKKCTAAEKKRGDYTKITFSPDLARFKMASLTKDTVGLLSKRAYDIAGSMSNSAGKKLAVTLNGKKLPIKSFQDYIKIYKGVNPPCAYEKVDDKWEVGVSHTSQDGAFMQISFVNAICTSKGGTHVNFVADMITKNLATAIEKKNKGGTKVSNNQIKNHLCVFVNSLVNNPTFDSQTKDHLTNRKTQFKNECKLSDKFLKQVAKSEIVGNILAYAKFKQNRDLKKSSGVKKIKLTGIPKLDDANRAGSKDSPKCTLILTEGDSAKSLAMSGLSVIGRDYYGVYPLKGKPLNVRDATHSAVMKNEEIKNVVDILGLKYDTVYNEENIKTLRYGHLMIMADQDHDGSHIKGLIINFIHNFWPSLLDVPGFLQQFITPIVKVSKGKKSETFFTIPQYENWREETGNNAKGWKIKYYKGLGTSTAADAKDYFSNLDLHEIGFEKLTLDIKKEDDDELEPVPDAAPSYGSGLIDMVFNKKRANDRKDWLQTLKKDTFLDYAAVKEEGVKFSEFINQEYILFSKADCERSIPHMMDGFKPSQRKVLFSCFKRKLKDEIKVAQLAGYIGEHSAYHHGEASLHTTIINMAQSYVGSNNVNLLTPSGQFGTRRMGGKDAASPRYIFTMLEKVTRTIFHPDDDELLNYLSDDGVSIEPEYYMPVIPMVLVNGSDGIGTGWSSKIPNYNPRQIITNIRNMINGEAPGEMHPYYSGFNGEIALDGQPGKYSCRGIIERTDDTTVAISELPIRTWTQDCKNFLEKMLVPSDKSSEAEIKDFTENHTDTTVRFTITATKEKIDAWEKLPKGGLYAKFKLVSSMSTTNMNLYDIDRKIVKHAKPEGILEAFFEKRMEFYVKRKQLLVKNLQKEQNMLSNKARFVEEVCSGDLVVNNRKKTELLDDLQARGYDLFDKTKKDENDDSDEENEDSSSYADLSRGYEYLLGMKLWNLTYEKVEELRKQLAEKTEELEKLESTQPSQIWLNDLDAIEVALDERDREIEQAEEDEMKAQQKTAARQASKGKKKKAAPRKRAPKKKKDDESVQEVAKKAPARKPAAKKAIIVDEEDDTDAEMELSLFDRLKLSKTISTDTSDSSLAGSKRPSPKESSKKAAPTKRAKAPSRTARKKAPAKAKQDVDLSDEEDFLCDSDSESDMDVEVVAAPSRPRRGARAKSKPATYAVLDDDDSFMIDSDDES
eukprot:CAMPEP_0116147982 /NCGR_PEP_ID=MMETSP0329-20121206/18076_1 /TAXON_ID=697910 /ORGANISM="Pseudo-nitzschia arenysensis, Strain B593" /LENGTH=1429 /DNA_ID=CAMNT_0003644009 /DNA_START=85 /DNA_END=4370 /DNA_ORIENTATION=-